MIRAIDDERSRRASWTNSLFWVPSLYLAMGIPFNAIQSTSARMYQSLGFAPERIALSIGWIGLVWSAKPLWAWALDRLGSKKSVVLVSEFSIAALFAVVATLVPTLPPGAFFGSSLALFLVAAFCSATQDICGDGIYLALLSRRDQARLSGLQSMFWTAGKVLAAGLLVSALESLRARNPSWSNEHMWALVMWSTSALMFAMGVYHTLFLPSGATVTRRQTATSALSELVEKREFWGMLGFILFYRLGEGLLLMAGPLFLQSAPDAGGLGFSPGRVASIESTFGTLAFVIGSLAGGALAARTKLRSAMPWFALALTVPKICYPVLGELAHAHAAPSFTLVATLISVEKAGYGFGFVVNMVYLMQQLAPGRTMMTHYAYGTALMNLVLAPTAMLSGSLSQWLGYRTFFWWVLPISCVSIWVAVKAPFPIEDGALQPLTNARGPSDDVVTVDDDTQLSSQERDYKRVAGQVSMFAFLHVLCLLIADTTLLGALRADVALLDQSLWYALLGLLATFKAMLGWRARSAARNARSLLPLEPTSSTLAYARNASAALTTTKVCLALDLLTLTLGIVLAQH